MTRALAAALTAVVLAAALAACPRAGGELAKPAPVELEWPDAAVPAGAADAGPVIQPGTSDA